MRRVSLEAAVRAGALIVCALAICIWLRCPPSKKRTATTPHHLQYARLNVNSLTQIGYHMHVRIRLKFGTPGCQALLGVPALVKSLSSNYSWFPWASACASVVVAFLSAWTHSGCRKILEAIIPSLPAAILRCCACASVALAIIALAPWGADTIVALSSPHLAYSRLGAATAIVPLSCAAVVVRTSWYLQQAGGVGTPMVQMAISLTAFLLLWAVESGEHGVWLKMLMVFRIGWALSSYFLLDWTLSCRKGWLFY